MTCFVPFTRAPDVHIFLIYFTLSFMTGKSRDVGDKNAQAWQDEQVTVFDCQERLRGYSFISIVDLDEFLLPLRDENLRDMMVGIWNAVSQISLNKHVILSWYIKECYVSVIVYDTTWIHWYHYVSYLQMFMKHHTSLWSFFFFFFFFFFSYRPFFWFYL